MNVRSPKPYGTLVVSRGPDESGLRACLSLTMRCSSGRVRCAPWLRNSSSVLVRLMAGLRAASAAANSVVDRPVERDASEGAGEQRVEH